MKRTWWDRWEDEMHFQPAPATPESSTLLVGALAGLFLVALVTAAIVGEYVRVGNLLDRHATMIATLILMTLVSLAALASVDAKSETD